MKRTPYPWRVQGSDGAATPSELARMGAFDEVVVGSFLHAEMLSHNSCFVQVGPLAVWLRIRPDGSGEITSSENRACPECQRLDGLGCHAAKCRRGRDRARLAKLAPVTP